MNHVLEMNLGKDLWVLIALVGRDVDLEPTERDTLLLKNRDHVTCRATAECEEQ